MKNTEKIPLFIIYTQNNKMNVEFSKDSNHYKIYGFLLVFLRSLEEQLINNINPEEDEESG